jgi:phage terminase large subunit
MWDLGINDTMSIWFVQVHQHEIRVIDYYESSGEGLAHYAKVLHEKPYVYSRHVVPHDIEVRELSTGKSRREALETLGVRPLEIVPALDVNDGIQAVRAILPRCWFDREKTDKGVKALSLYRKAWDEKNKVFRTMPLHDWASHPSDAFRMGAIAEGKRAPANFNRKINYPKSGVA